MAVWRAEGLREGIWLGCGDVPWRGGACVGCGGRVCVPWFPNLRSAGAAGDGDAARRIRLELDGFVLLLLACRCACFVCGRERCMWLLSVRVVVSCSQSFQNRASVNWLSNGMLHAGRGAGLALQLPCRRTVSGIIT